MGEILIKNGSREIAVLLPKTLDISQAESFLELLKACDAHSEVVMDASAVERITTPCVQLIISLFQSVQMARGSFRIKRPSSAMKEVFSELGLAEQMKVWSAEA